MTEKVIVKNISKKFKVGYKKKQNFLEKVINFISGKESQKILWALKDVSFTVKAGEVVGIIGLNGSGKSTLLRTIAGIYQKDGGTLRVEGRIIPLISLEVGLKYRLTMRENIYLGCTLFGLDKKDIKKIFNNIVSLAELESFVDAKLYQFSSGMIARLVFAIAINCTTCQQPDIILLDEIFYVGDGEFKTKSLAELVNLKKIKAAGILVTHDLPIVKEHSDKVIWLHQGKIVKQGDPEEVVESYKASLKNYLLDNPAQND